MSAASYGDVIFVDRGVYDHYGIYSGNSKVIHYVKDKNGGMCDGIIKETSLATFLDKDSFYNVIDFDKGDSDSIVKSLVKMGTIKGGSKILTTFLGPLGGPAGIVAGLALGYAGEKLFDAFSDKPKLYSPDETVRRARGEIGKRGYSLVVHNCEHFAMWCKTGSAESSQVNNVIGLVKSASMFSKIRI